jgi:acyl-CoA thioesterase II
MLTLDARGQLCSPFPTPHHEPPLCQAVDPTLLAIMADHAPSGIGSALGRGTGGNSLDNTIRFFGRVETEWVLRDIQIDAAHGGFAHGAVRLFAQNGRLMALASQSMIPRIGDGGEARERSARASP